MHTDQHIPKTHAQRNDKYMLRDADIRRGLRRRNDGSLVIDEFADGRVVQFWSCRRGSNCHTAKCWGCCEVESPSELLLCSRPSIRESSNRPTASWHRALQAERFCVSLFRVDGPMTHTLDRQTDRQTCTQTKTVGYGGIM